MFVQRNTQGGFSLNFYLLYAVFVFTTGFKVLHFVDKDSGGSRVNL